METIFHSFFGDKYILLFGQIRLTIWTNICCHLEMGLSLNAKRQVSTVHVTAITSLAIRRLLQQGEEIYKKAFWEIIFFYKKKSVNQIDFIIVANVHVTVIIPLAIRRLLQQGEEIYKKAFSPERKDWCKTEPAAKPEGLPQIYICWKRNKYL